MVDDAWLTTVRIARDCGDISSLFPPGVTRLWDLPFTLHQAIHMALYYLSFENLPEKERPPKKFWQDGDKLKLWFDEVKANREAENRGEGDYQSMPQNQILKEMFGGRAPVA